MHTKVQIMFYVVIALLMSGYFFIGNQTCSSLPAREVKVSVENGQVLFVTKDAKSDRTLQAGDQIAINDKLQIKDIAKPANTETPKAENVVLAISLASLKLSIHDTDGHPFVPQDVILQDVKGRQSLTIEADGTVAVDSLPVGNIEILASDSRLLGESRKKIALSEGRNEETLVVARRSAFQAAIQSPQGEPVAGGGGLS